MFGGKTSEYNQLITYINALIGRLSIAIKKILVSLKLLYSKQPNLGLIK